MNETGLTAETPEEVGMSAERVQRAKDLAASWVEDGITPSLVVLAARRGKIVLHEAFGQLAPGADPPPLQRDSIFPVASLTKPITATLAMTLVEDGLLGLNRPVIDYIPEFQGKGKDAVLVHHLLTHTSGLNDDLFSPAELLQPGEEFHFDEGTQHPLIERILQAHYGTPLSLAPGREMSYSNFGYLLLGEIVRRVSGQGLADFSGQRLFGPLGMRDTTFIVEDSDLPRIVQRSADLPLGDVPEFFFKLPSPMGGVTSTAIDLATFCQMFLNGGTHDGKRILSSPTVAAMTRNQIPGISTTHKGDFHAEASWSYGWSISGGRSWKYQPGTLISPESFGHGGAGGSYAWVDPVNEIVGVYLSVTVERIDAQDIIYAEHFSNAITAAIDD